MKIKTTRKSWVAGADPTQVTRWTITLGRRIEIRLTASWGVEPMVRLGAWRREAYDAWWAIRLFGWLENRWEQEQMQYDEDPMGRPGDYI